MIIFPKYPNILFARVAAPYQQTRQALVNIFCYNKPNIKYK